MKRKRTLPWPLIIASLGGLLLVALIGLTFIGLVVGEGSSGGRYVALINFYGPISDTEGGKLFGERGPRDFIKELEAARRDKQAAAVVIRINSPGGSAAASQELYEAIRRVREEKPVLCSMGDVAASGGYYMAAACDKIYASPATVTGSIGVVSQFLNLRELLDKIGVQDATITSGKFKDAGSPFRALRPEERQLFEAMIQDIYQQFVDDVVAGRKEATGGKLTREALLKVADGRVLTGRQAKQQLLIDELGGLRETIEAAGKQGGIEGTPTVRELSGGGSLSALFGAESGVFSSGVAAVAHGAGQAFSRGFSRELARQLREDTGATALPQVR